MTTDRHLIMGRVIVYVNVKEVPVAELVLGRLMGEKTFVKIDIDSNSVDWGLGFDTSKSYSGDRHKVGFELYDDWQTKLTLVPYDSREQVPEQIVKGQPFTELVNLKRGIGIIGTVVCDKLLKDFSYFMGNAHQMEKDFFWDIYFKFTLCFITATADQGVVIIQHYVL